MCGFAPAAVPAHLRWRFQGCTFPVLPFPASRTSASAPRAQLPAGATAKLVLMPRRPARAIAITTPAAASAHLRWRFLCCVPCRSMRADRTRVRACCGVRAFAPSFSGLRVPCASVPASHAGIFAPCAQSPTSPRPCPAAPRAQSPAGAAAKPAFMLQHPTLAIALAAALAITCALYRVQAYACRSVRAFVPSFPWLRVPYASVPSIARQCFRPAHVIADRRCRQARAHAPAPHARNRRQALPPSPRSCPGAPRAQSPAGATAKPALMPQHPTRAVACPHRSRRQARATLPCALCRARACACFEVCVLRHVVSGAVRSLCFRSWHRAPVLPPCARNRQHSPLRQARAWCPALPPNRPAD